MEDNKKIINGVEVIEDGEITHFHIIDDKKEEEKVEEPKTFWGRIINWFKRSKVKPYIKIRDSADPFYDRRNSVNGIDSDAGSDGKYSGEIGIKVEF